MRNEKKLFEKTFGLDDESEITGLATAIFERPYELLRYLSPEEKDQYLAIVEGEFPGSIRNLGGEELLGPGSAFLYDLGLAFRVTIADRYAKVEVLLLS